MDKQTYKKCSQRQKRKGENSLWCTNCGEDDQRVIEMHHSEGRNNSEYVHPLCKNCHTKVTSEQNKLSPKARSKNASPKQKRAMQFVSIGAELVLFGNTLLDIGNEMDKDD